MGIPDSEKIKHRQEACKTFIEQTKLLTSLASAFIIAPAVVSNFLKASLIWPIIAAELLFVVSVLAGYIALGAIAGSQHRGNPDVHRPAVRLWGLTQFIAYLGGIGLFGYWFIISYPSATIGNP
jgi:hypothetical protein